MLRQLHISNLAIIADAAVDFAPGLNVLTGPTGAGKSLLIGAIEILLGLRAPAKMANEDGSEGRVTGVFEIADSTMRADLAAVLDAELTDDELHLVRRVLPTGRTSASVNGQPVPSALLRQVGERLIDIHGQHDHQFLLRPSNQLTLLDELAGIHDLRHSAAERLRLWRNAIGRRDCLRSEAQRRAERAELLTFQARDIDDAAPQIGELERVEARHRLLSQLDHVRNVCTQACSELSEGDAPIADQLARIAHRLSELGTADPASVAIAEQLTSAALTCREAARDLLAHVESLDANPGELAVLDARLGVLRRLIGRYGSSLDEVLRHRSAIAAELNAILQADSESAGADAAVQATQDAYEGIAARLTRARRGAASELIPAVAAELAELGLERATFDIAISPAEPTPAGSDAVEFMICTNPGQPSRSLRDIASSGEMNRILLALKSVAAGSDRCSVLVFDEVDANVGGRMGAVIGRKLRRLATTHQVLCITHLPQIAAFADRHLHVAKRVSAGRTRSVVQMLTGDERVEELAEMIAGKGVSDTTRRQARDLIAEAGGESAPRPSPPPRTRRRAGASALRS